MPTARTRATTAATGSSSVSGEVFARHGTSSERWTHADIARIRQGLRDRERERWRREFREDLTATLAAASAAQNVASGPAGVLDWRLDEETLVGAVIEQVRGFSHRCRR
jgi:hypothetical protein